MKKIGFMLTVLIIGCSQSAPANTKNDPSKKDSIASSNKVIPMAELFTLKDAEQILGEPAALTDSSTYSKEGTTTYSSAYIANAKDLKTGKTGNVYFLCEHYPDVESAHKGYQFIKDGNEKNGIEVVKDLGDEAYFHTDGTNFYFILVRKGQNMFRMKVNKITGNTSKDNFNLVAKNITALI